VTFAPNIRSFHEMFSGLALGSMQLAMVSPIGRHSPIVHRGSGPGSPAFWATATVVKTVRRNVEIRGGNNIVVGAGVEEVGGV